MATVKSALALEDRMTPTLNKIEKSALKQINTFNDYSKSVDNVKKSLDAAEKANPNIVKTEVYAQAAQALEKMEGKLWDVANGNDAFNDSLDESEKKTRALSSAITSIVGWAAITKGTKAMMQLSDQTSQTRARLGQMTEDVGALENKVFQAAQRTRVGYQGMADTVAKLGMQAGEAFNNSEDEIIHFNELLTKVFTASGLDANAIQSVMYNMTQSLSSGKLLGQDYRILKQNAPQMIKYLREYYNVSQAELDELVHKGEVSAQALKKAIFKAGDDIEKKFNAMPVTFGQAWTKFKNTFVKIQQPILNILSKMADGLDKIFTFLSEHQYILYILLGAIGLIAGAILIYNTYTTIATFVTTALSSAMGVLTITMIAVVAVIAVVAAALLYLWNTDDEAAYGMLEAWDNMYLGMLQIGAALKAVWYGLATIVETVCVIVLETIQSMVNGVLGAINVAIEAVNVIPGVDVDELEYASFGDRAASNMMKNMEDRANDLAEDYDDIAFMQQQLDESRDERVADRAIIGMDSFGADVGGAVGSALDDSLEDLIGTDKGGGKALKTTTDDKLIDDEDMQLLLDVATRDYKLNYQQVTPNITLTFGDIRETADVDEVLDKLADRLEEVYDGNLG